MTLMDRHTSQLSESTALEHHRKEQKQDFLHFLPAFVKLSSINTSLPEMMFNLFIFCQNGTQYVHNYNGKPIL